MDLKFLFEKLKFNKSCNCPFLCHIIFRASFQTVLQHWAAKVMKIALPVRKEPNKMADCHIFCFFRIIVPDKTCKIYETTRELVD
jgi:hypothetical protein